MDRPAKVELSTFQHIHFLHSPFQTLPPLSAISTLLRLATASPMFLEAILVLCSCHSPGSLAVNLRYLLSGSPRTQSRCCHQALWFCSDPLDQHPQVPVSSVFLLLHPAHAGRFWQLLWGPVVCFSCLQAQYTSCWVFLNCNSTPSILDTEQVLKGTHVAWGKTRLHRHPAGRGEGVLVLDRGAAGSGSSAVRGGKGMQQHPFRSLRLSLTRRDLRFSQTVPWPWLAMSLKFETVKSWAWTCFLSPAAARDESFFRMHPESLCFHTWFRLACYCLKLFIMFL